jgi:hypothetical protein
MSHKKNGIYLGNSNEIAHTLQTGTKTTALVGKLIGPKKKICTLQGNTHSGNINMR